MLLTILISTVIVAVVFAVVSKFTKKSEKSIKQQPNTAVIEEPLGYETSSLAAVEETISLPIVEIVEVKATDIFPEPVKTTKKPKTKMSAKPKAPKKKKNA